MCECAKVHVFEGELKLEGRKDGPTHKNGGLGLDEKQEDKLQKEVGKYWGVEEEEE